MKNNYLLQLLIALFFAAFLMACGSAPDTSSDVKTVDEAAVLIKYLEENGNYINSPQVPANIDAVDVYNNLTRNILIIDIRDAASFSEGHIKGALNIEPDSLLNYFEQVIEPNGFDTIVFVCDIGARSAFVTGVFRLLGYNNVYSMKFGLSAWNSRYANSLWMANLSSHLESELTIENNTLPEQTYSPVLNTGFSQPYLILRERARVILSDSLKKYFIGIDQVAGNYSKYFIIKYWPEKLNHLPQLPGSYSFIPKKSLSSDASLYKIPTDKPVVVYCNSATHGSFVVAFLRLLGYEAYSLRYGTNAFMYNVVQKETPDHAFIKDFVSDFPVESSSTPVLQQQTDAPAVKVKGGC